MATIEGSRIRIPFFNTYGPPKVGTDIPHKPSRDNPDGAIGEKINGILRLRDPRSLSDGDFTEVIIPSISPHHKIAEGSIVHWLPKIKYENGIPLLERWENPTSWSELIQSEFLMTFQEKMVSQADNGRPFYLQFGFSPFNSSPLEGFTKQGPQTIKRGHGHSTPLIDQHAIDGYMKIFEGMTEEEFRHVALFFDFGAQLAREHIAQVKDFASFEHKWKQMDGMVERTAYGFLSIKDALSQLLSTFMSLSKDNRWTTIATELYKKYEKDFTVKVGSQDKSLLLFSPVPGGALFIPTPEERELMGLPSDCPYKVFVSLFSPIMKPHIVNGLYTIRK